MKHKDFYAKKLPRRKLWILMACIWGFTYWGFGQVGGNNVPIQFCGSYQALPPNGTNPDSLITDRFGNLFDFEDLHLASQSLQSVNSCAAAGYFSPVYYGEVPANAIPVLCEVLEDVSAIVKQRTGENNCGQLSEQTVIIQIAWLNFSNPDPAVLLELELDPSKPLPISAGGIGTPFYSNPTDFACKEVILERPFIKINGGRPQPASSADGRILINSAYAWNFDSNLPTGGFPGQVDLYSIFLHEVMHMMGYASRIGFTDAYSLWDQTLRVVDNYQAGGGGNMPVRVIENSSGCVSNCWHNITNLIDIATNSCSPTNSMGPDVVVGDAALAPIGGVSLPNQNDPNYIDDLNNMFSHLSVDCSGQNIDYVMNSGLSSNTARRNMTIAEQQIFCALGYEVQSPSAACNGCYNIAHPDIQYDSEASCCFKAFTICSGETLEILNEELLCNDISNSSSATISRIWQHQPLGNVNVSPNQNGTGWLIQVSSPPSTNLSPYGGILMAYTVTGCDCRQHNMLFYLQVYVECPPCVFESDPCENLLCYNDFENFNNTNTSIETAFGWPIIFEGSTLIGTPDICVTTEEDHNLHLLGGTDIEAVTLELMKCIEPGCKLEMSMDMSAEFALPALVEVWGSKNRPCDATVLGAHPIENLCAQNSDCIP